MTTHNVFTTIISDMRLIVESVSAVLRVLSETQYTDLITVTLTL